MSKVDPPPLDSYRIISDAIERAILPGLRKAEKRDLLRSNSDADLDAAAEIIHGYIMCDLEEVVCWPDPHGCDAPPALTVDLPDLGVVVYGCGCKREIKAGDTIPMMCPGDCSTSSGWAYYCFGCNQTVSNLDPHPCVGKD